jgi:predicted O-linked N-acetylglucosamine transferase (SPINDLY family)
MIPAADIPALAARFHHFGAFHHAERLYRQALEAHPDDSELWAGLGRTGQTLGRHDDAVANFRRALELDPNRVDFNRELGVALMELGRWDEALASFDEALRFDAGDPTTHMNVGMAQMAKGDPAAAAASYRQALLLDAQDPIVACHLGNALFSLGEHDQALDLYRRAVQLRPDFAEAWLNLGRLLRANGEHGEAAACFEGVAQLRPDDPESRGELAALLMNRGELDAAVAGYEELLRIRPDLAEAYSNMGLALLALGRLDEARLSFEQALYLRPDLAEVHNNLGLALLNQGRPADARLSFEQAIRIRPDLVDARNNLGLAWDALGQPDLAIASFESAVEIDSNHLGALTNLANACRDQGRAAEAIALYHKALAATPGAAEVHSNLLLAMHYQGGADARQILAEARRYARDHAEPLAGATEPRPHRPLAGRRLRIGYVSADFREHPVACFLEPILACHDHRQIELYCYADVPQPDATTERLRAHADVWRSLVGLSDAQAAGVIRQDEIDILVDLAGHTGGNRLLVFARKPAPIQMSYLGYLGTTGLPAMDYYITDAHADPPGCADAHYQERLVRLPECAFCYRPGPAPDVNPELSVRRSGRVVFGCLNNPAKVSDLALACWSQVLASVPGSALLLRSGAGRGAVDRIRDILGQHGIAPERVRFAGPVPTRFAYLELYHEIDISLDPFPYNGVTTTCDALWMGAPVISLAGSMSVSRQGVRFLRSVGLDELLADSPEHYVRIASTLAGDRARLAALRSALRERMTHSPLLDARRLTRDLEAACRELYEKPLAAREPITP